MNDTIIKGSITLIDSLSRLNKNHIDTLLTKSSIDTNSITVLGIPENIARILIPAIVSILVLLLSQLFSWYFKKREKQLEIQSYRNVILNWIELIDLSVKKQIEACNKFSKKIEDSKNIHPEPFIYVKMLTEKVDNIGLDRFINTFIINSTHPLKSKNDKMTFNLVSQFSFLTAIESEISKTYNVYQEQIFSFMNEWNEYLTQLENLVSNYSKIINNDNKNPLFNFHLDLKTLSTKWKQTAPDGIITVEHTINSLFNPLTNMVELELSKNISNEYAFEIASILQKIRILEKKWKTNIKGNAQVFKDYSKNIEASYNALIYARDYFNNNTKVSNIWRIK